MGRPKKNNNSPADDAGDNNQDMDEREKKMELALAALRKQFGDESIMALGDSVKSNVRFQTTGIFSVDRALGGGLPKGRIIEVYGPESGGKTTFCLKAIAEVQKAGGIAAFIDAEHALDPQWARKNGVDIDRLLVSQPENGEQALEIAHALARTGFVDLVVVDSVAALVPKAELEGEIGDAHVGRQARLMSQAMRMLTADTSKSGTTLIFINQIREKVGVMFGNPETTTGGRALKFFASMRLEVRKSETIKENGEEIANRVKIKVVKNKVAPPFKTAEYEIRFDSGVDPVKDVIEVAVAQGVMEKAGAWYKYEGENIGQGVEKTRKALLENEELYKAIWNKL